MIIQKQYARRSIVGYRSAYHDPCTYRSIETVTNDEALRIFAGSVEATLSADIDPDPVREFAELVKAAGSAYDPAHWYIAYEGDAPVGCVFPQRYWDKMEEGSIFSIGVLPAYRKMGFGKILHAKGLQTLAELGVEEYVGSTDIRNAPMISVFLANGCRLTAIRTIEMDGHGEQKIIG